MCLLVGMWSDWKQRHVVNTDMPDFALLTHGTLVGNSHSWDDHFFAAIKYYKSHPVSVSSGVASKSKCNGNQWHLLVLCRFYIIEILMERPPIQQDDTQVHDWFFRWYRICLIFTLYIIGLISCILCICNVNVLKY